MLLDELADAGFRAQAAPPCISVGKTSCSLCLCKTDFDFFYLPMDHSPLAKTLEATAATTSSQHSALLLLGNAANLGYCWKLRSVHSSAWQFPGFIGSGFINFTEPALANAFAAAFQGRQLRGPRTVHTEVVLGRARTC